MGGFGFGFGSHLAGMRRMPGEPFGLTAPLRPGASWNGIAGSGFSSIPADPVRITAKPTCRLIVPPDQAFADRLHVGVMAAANNGGTLLDNLGLERVSFHYEGNVCHVERPSFQTFLDANGNPVTYFGWWCLLKHNGTNGKARLYIEAVPKDPAMQTRVIGPYQFVPVATLYDLELEVAPTPAEIVGQRYKTLQAAFTYVRTSAAKRPRITFTQAGIYDFSAQSSTYTADTHVVIEASVPVTIRKAVAENSVTSMRSRINGLCWRGENITIDFLNHTAMHIEAARPIEHWYDGVTMTCSGGRYSLWFKTHRNLGNALVGAGSYVTECNFTNLYRIGDKTSLMRGNVSAQTWDDMMTGSLCVIGNVAHDHDSAEYRQYIPALTVNYSGAGTTATLEMTGTSNATSRTLTARVNGTSVGSFIASRTNVAFAAGTNYDVADVAAWINSLPGWSATLLDDTRVAVALQRSGTVGTWSGFNAKAGGTLFTFFDVHADFYQVSGNTENVVVFGNTATKFDDSQNFHLTDNAIRDFLIANNAISNNSAVLVSNQNSAHSHVVMIHNTMSQQNINLRTDQTYNPDVYCLLANNAVKAITWNGAPDADLVIANNHLHSGSSAPAGSTGTIIGGNAANLFVDEALGDFTPAGELALGSATPRLGFDIRNRERTLLAAAGAVN